MMVYVVGIALVMSGIFMLLWLAAEPPDPIRKDPPEMRVILLLKNNEGFYVLSAKPTLSEDQNLWKGLQATGGVVVVPAKNVLAYESYITDSEIEYAFRTRLAELQGQDVSTQSPIKIKGMVG